MLLFQLPLWKLIRPSGSVTDQVVVLLALKLKGLLDMPISSLVRKEKLETMEVRTSQFHPGQEIPEKSWMYRLVKKFFYNDFGVYDGHDHSASSAPAVLELPTVVEEDEPVAV